jgi:ribosomal protein L30/L7E
MMANLKISWESLNGCKDDQIATAQSLGLTSRQRSNQPDNEPTKGKIKNFYLVEVTEALKQGVCSNHESARTSPAPGSFRKRTAKAEVTGSGNARTAGKGHKGRTHVPASVYVPVLKAARCRTKTHS